MNFEKNIEAKFKGITFKKVLTYFLLASCVMIGFSNTHVIKDTEVGVKVYMGKIQPKSVDTGMAFTVPFVEDLRRVNTTEQRKDYEGITLATRADAASPATGNIVITYAINGIKAPAILKEFGTVDIFIDTRLNQPMLSKARIAASAIADTRALMSPEARVKLGEDIKRSLDASHSGYHIQNVMIQSIIPHGTIRKRINASAQRAEDDVIEKHNLTLATSVAATATAEANGNEAVKNANSRAEAFKKTSNADALAHAVRVAGAAKKQAMFDLALGNAKLDKSLTPNILRKQELDNEAILYSKSRGLVPATVIGKTDLRSYGFPTSTK